MSINKVFNESNNPFILAQSYLLEMTPSIQKTLSYKDKINLFSHDVFDFLNTCSLKGIRPLLFTATSFQCGLKQWNSDSLWARIKGLVKITLCVMVSLPMAILSMPGITFRAICSVNRNSFAFSPTVNKVIDNHRTDKTIHVMTWNVGLGPKFMSVTNGLADSNKRIGAIVNQIEQENVDIIALQEVFDSTASSELVRQLNLKGYDCIHSILSKGTTQISSGLFVAVKRRAGMELTISEVKAWKFTNGSSTDKLSNKGLLGIKFSVKMENVEKVMYVFNTHLQASYGKNGFSSVRKEQVKGIAAKIYDWTQNQADNVLICGDLNFGASRLEPGDDENEYQEQMETFRAIRLTDGNREAQLASVNPMGLSESRNGTFMDVNIKERSKALVDYILYGLGFVRSVPRIVEISKNHPSSDHYPVVQGLMFAE